MITDKVLLPVLEDVSSLIGEMLGTVCQSLKLEEEFTKSQ
jgi:hypothetical protein